MGASGFIKEKLGYYGNFSLGIGLIIICILYTVIFLKVSCLIHIYIQKETEESIWKDSRDLRPPEIQKQIDQLEEKKKGGESKGENLTTRNQKDNFEIQDY